ncbi:helix-turn-helix transcriptional regulator [Paenibacillus thermotolerans]|uniref:helix-turn-helix transcriptional regulator n=1 Tax=Paenibacillus thermotolerans TaxID=3027807 RepID=UPI0023680F64|nr:MULTISPECIES: winged helix-turn-helix transcriptional regulator [unclassified Paenibacillus]
MNEQNPTTRKQIVTMLRKKGRLNAHDIAKELGITDIAVRRHVNALMRDRLVRAETFRQAMGRPTLLYSLTEQAEQLFPKHYSDITLDFLNDVRDLQGTEMIDELFVRRESRLERKYKEKIDANEPLEHLVQELTKLQDERGYMAEWEKDEEGGRFFIKEHNCPIHSIAQEYTQACSSELSLFRKVLGAEVEQLECKAKGGERCVYAVKPRS